MYLAAVNGRVGTVNWNIPLDVAKFRGRVFMEADVKGRDLQRGAQGHHGPNIMLFLKFPDGSRQKNRWLKLPNEFGSFDWKTWALVAEIRKLDKTPPVVTQSIARHYPPEMNVIYSPHIYQPHTLTHFGVGTFGVKWSYPGYINGVWWDREQQRVSAEAVIRFQCEHPDARIFVGEFSCVGWVKGADRWIADAIDLFEEYGWDWTYHAFREWQAWDVEREPEKLYDADDRHMRPAKQDTPRKIALLKGLARNGRPPLAK